MNIAVFDIILLVILGVAALRGLLRGFIAEVFDAGAIVLGVLFSIVFNQPVSKLIDYYLHWGGWSQAAAFAAIFIVVVIIMLILKGTLTKLIDELDWETMDKVMGLLLGLVEGILLSSIIIIGLSRQPVIDVSGLLDPSVGASIFRMVLVAILGTPV